MLGDVSVEYVAGLIAMFVVAAFSAVFFKRVGFPFTIGLVAVGVGLGLVVPHIESLSIMADFRITPNILLYVLLPALLFDAAINMEVRLLKRNLVPVLTLAAPGMLIATIITAAIVAALTPLAFLPALAFGALISTTDPVAVISLFKEVGAPKRLVMLVDGESLFNDATAIVAFQVVVGLLAGGVIGAAAFFQAGMDFAFVFAGGFAVGLGVGWMIVQLLAVAKGDPFVEMTFTTIAAYLSFILAQFYLDLSGVMAVVGTGMIIEHYSRSRFSADGLRYMKMFWAFASFVTNSLIFLMLGITEFHQIVNSGFHKGVLLYVGVAILAVLVARIAAIYGLVPLLNRLPKANKIDFAHQTVMFWGGLRGALPMGLAISLTPGVFGPEGESVRAMIIEMTFGVVIFTLLIQGTTIKGLIGWLGLDRPSNVDRSIRAYGRSVAKKNAYKALEKLQEEWCLIDEGALAPELAMIAGEECQAREELTDALNSPAKEKEIKSLVLWSQAITLSRQFAAKLYDCGFISEWTMRQFQQNCEGAFDDVQNYKYPPPDFDKAPFALLRAQDAIMRGIDRLFTSLHLRKRQSMLRIKRMFEWYSLLSEIAVMIDSELARISQLCGAGREEVTQCRNYFESIYEVSRDKLTELRRSDPDAVEVLVRKTVENVSLIAELQSVRELADTGGIPDEAAGFLLGDLRARME